MGKINKTKIIVTAIVVLAVIAVIATVVILLNKDGNEEDSDSKVGTISNIDSELDGLKGKNIELTYDEGSNQTVIDFVIENTTEEKVENMTVEIQLLDESEKIIASVDVRVSAIEAKSEHKVNMMLGGNIQGIKKLKIVNPQQAEAQ